MSRHLTLLGVALALTLAATAQAQLELFPNTKELGGAAIQYKDDAIHVVAAYYYSQRNHDSRWLLIEAAVSTEERMTIHRDSIRLITPDGVEVTLAAQARFARDIQRTRLLVQNATPTRHGIGSYFNRRNQSENFRFFLFPSDPIVSDDFIVDSFRVVWGDLFFESPTGSWESGTYTLAIEHEGGRAEVPIELE